MWLNYTKLIVHRGFDLIGQPHPLSSLPIVNLTKHLVVFVKVAQCRSHTFGFSGLNQSSFKSTIIEPAAGHMNSIFTGGKELMT